MWRSGRANQERQQPMALRSTFPTPGTLSPSLTYLGHPSNPQHQIIVLEILRPSVLLPTQECTVITLRLDPFRHSNDSRSLYHNPSTKVDPEPIPTPYPSFVPVWCLTPVQGQQGLLTPITCRAIAESTSNI